MAELTVISLDDPVDASLTAINGNFSEVASRISGKAELLHTHSASDIASGLMDVARLGSGTPAGNTFLRGDGSWARVDWASLTGVPATFTPSAHQHAVSDLTQSGAATGQALVWHGSVWAPGTVSGSDSPTPLSAQSASFTAVSNHHYLLTAGSITVTLPASPADGDWVDLAGSVSGAVVARNGKTIMGLAEDMSLNVSPFAVRLVYVASLGDWRLTT